VSPEVTMVSFEIVHLTGLRVGLNNATSVGETVCVPDPHAIYCMGANPKPEPRIQLTRLVLPCVVSNEIILFFSPNPY